jgi:hypothetical protein
MTPLSRGEARVVVLKNALHAMGETVDMVVAVRDLHPWAALTAQDLRIRQVLRAYTGPERIAVPSSGDQEPDNRVGIASDC